MIKTFDPWRFFAKWAVCAALGLAGHAAVWAEMLTLTQATAQVKVDGITSKHTVSLPYHWDRYNQGHAGEAWFDLYFDLPQVPDEPWSMYFPRLGNAYEVWLNGELLKREGDLLHYNGADYSQVPRQMVISTGLLAVSNHLRVHVRADVGRRGGLSQVVIGPQNEVDAVYHQRYLWRSYGPLAVAMFSLVVGLISLSLWATQPGNQSPAGRARDSLYLFAGLAELSWSLGVGYMLLEAPPLPWPWWGLVPVLALALWIFNMTQFCLHVAGWGGQPAATWFGRWMAFATACGPLMAYWALGLGQAVALTAWYLTVGLSCLVFGALFLWRACRGATWAHRGVALALLVNVFTGLRDVYVYRVNPSYGEDTYLRYASVLFGLSLAYIVITRFRSAAAQARDLQATLNQRVHTKEAELAQSYQQLEAMAREHERTAERARILRDMHDGVGSHISAAIRQLESGRATQADVLLTLRESLDQLKLSIDAMTLPPGDINALLANLRYRMEPRFNAIDVTLSWNVDSVPVLARLDADAMRQLQFLIFEAMSNVLQHARAQVLSIQAMATGPAYAPMVLVRVMDDGQGFDVQAAQGKGLVSMRQRAEGVGAALDISSEPGRTCIDIRLA
ncbi:MAG: hypothetical protein RLZZ591_11 [Pseudomonadota bacterium]